MQPKKICAGLAALGLALSACVPVTASRDDANLCGAAGYQSLIGSSFAAMTLPEDLDARIVGPDMAVTTDHRPTRMNIWVDRGGIVERIYCG